MKARLSTADLPPEQRQLLDPEFLENEQHYARMRDSLLATHRGQWVAVRGGQVVAAGQDLLAVSDAAASAGGHPFIARVGEEETPFRVRRAVFAYESAYQPFALPQVTVTFWNYTRTRSQTYSDVIPDTGADVSVLPHADCAAFELFSSPYLMGVARGVTGGSVTTLIYRATAEIAGGGLTALVQPLRSGRERIVGRDVLNQCSVTFDGPRGLVIFNP